MRDEARTATPRRTLSASGDQRLGRRAFLQRGLEICVTSGLALAAGTFADLDDAGTITYALARPAPGRGTLSPRRRSVPPIWHRSLQLAFDARDRLREAVVEPLVDATVVPGTYDDPEAGLSLSATTESALESLAELVPELPLDREVVDEALFEPDSDFALPDAHRAGSLEDSGVPGGVVCEGASVYGTLSPALFDARSGRRYFATSNHVYGAGGAVESGHAGSALHLPTEGETRHVGDVVRG